MMKQQDCKFHFYLPSSVPYQSSVRFKRFFRSPSRSFYSLSTFVLYVWFVVLSRYCLLLKRQWRKVNQTKNAVHLLTQNKLTMQYVTRKKEELKKMCRWIARPIEHTNKKKEIEYTMLLLVVPRYCYWLGLEIGFLRHCNLLNYFQCIHHWMF